MQGVKIIGLIVLTILGFIHFVNDGKSEERLIKELTSNKWHNDVGRIEKLEDQRFKPKPGDILVTNKSIVTSLFGHSAIYIGDDTVVEIKGYHQYPIKTRYQDFLKQNATTSKWVKIYRVPDRDVGKRAADFAAHHLADTDMPYALDPTLRNLTSTYCSKLIWQAYYYGAGASSVTGSDQLVISPYLLPTYIKGAQLVAAY